MAEHRPPSTPCAPQGQIAYSRHLVLTCSCSVRLRAVHFKANPCRLPLHALKASPKSMTILTNMIRWMRRMTCSFRCSWEAAGRVRLERRAEDGMLEVAPNEEAQRELDKIDARNATASNVDERAEDECEPSPQRSRTRSPSRSRSRRRRRVQRRRDTRRRRSSTS